MSSHRPRPFSPPVGTAVQVDFGGGAQDALETDRYGLGLTQIGLVELFQDRERQVDVDTFLRSSPRRVRRVKLDSGRVLAILFEVLLESQASDHVCILNFTPEDEAR